MNQNHKNNAKRCTNVKITLLKSNFVNRKKIQNLKYALETLKSEYDDMYY